MADEFEGYREGDITYCLIPNTTTCFPVRVEKVGKDFLDVVAIDEEMSKAASPEFAGTKANRRFHRPELPPSSRFGGCDERPVNSNRVSGVELRLLPTHYGTTTGKVILEHHKNEPRQWPLPTGLVFERWFKDKGAGL
jgi:hypothetical protein